MCMTLYTELNQTSYIYFWLWTSGLSSKWGFSPGGAAIAILLDFSLFCCVSPNVAELLKSWFVIK